MLHLTFGRRSAVVALALAVVPVHGWGAAPPLILPETQVFPGDDGASATTLDQPLAELVGAWQKRTGRRSFRKSMVIHKSRRRLDVFADGVVLKSYIVELGSAPRGAKQRQGDMKTPEGDLFICAKNRTSAFVRYLGIAYPTPAAAHDGVEAGKVARGVEQEVISAFRTRRGCPPQQTPLGGLVGIHGGGSWEKRADGFLLTDWTWGCVAVRDADIRELFDGYVELGTPLRIEAD